LGGEGRAVQVAEAILACGLVAVVAGTDLIRTFASLGAVVVPGGPGSAPPVGEILDAIRSAAAVGVAVLPNHADVQPAAAEAAAAADAPVLVVPATSVPAGLAAAAAYNASANLEENARAMAAAAAACRSAAVVRAVGEARSALGVAPPESWVGMTAGEIVVTGESAEQVGVALIGWLASSSDGEAGPGIPVELITLIVGAEADPSATTALTRAICTAFAGAEVEVLDGGQPVEAYVIGME
jgi:dihydroxyacetone kinase-like predicted kinase